MAIKINTTKQTAQPTQLETKRTYQEVKESLLKSLRFAFIGANKSLGEIKSSRGFALAKEIKLYTLYQPVEIFKDENTKYVDQKKYISFVLKSDYKTEDGQEVSKDLIVKIHLSHIIDGNIIHTQIFRGLGSFEEREFLATALSHVFAPFIENDEGGKLAISHTNSLIKNVSITTKNKDGELYINPETNRKVEYYDVVLSQKGIDFLNAEIARLNENKLISRIANLLSDKKE